MDKAKDISTLRKGISISLVITILFTCGFVLGALTKAVDSMNVEPVPETTVVTTTQVPETTTAVPTTAAPTTTAPETTTAVPETETTTTAPSSEETTTTAPAEGTEEEAGFIAGLIVSLLEFKKQIIDFIISIFSSLPF